MSRNAQIAYDNGMISSVEDITREWLDNHHMKNVSIKRAKAYMTGGRWRPAERHHVGIYGALVPFYEPWELWGIERLRRKYLAYYKRLKTWSKLPPQRLFQKLKELAPDGAASQTFWDLKKEARQQIKDAGIRITKPFVRNRRFCVMIFIK